MTSMTSMTLTTSTTSTTLMPPTTSLHDRQVVVTLGVRKQSALPSPTTAGKVRITAPYSVPITAPYAVSITAPCYAIRTALSAYTTAVNGALYIA